MDPRLLGAKATLTARLGAASAFCEVTVSLQDEGPGLQLGLADKAQGKYRAEVEKHPDRIVINVLGGHPAIRRYLGPGPQFPLQDTFAARSTMAEIYAGEAARLVLEKKFQVAGELDAPAFYSEHLAYLTKYLARCHKWRIDDAELGSGS